MDRGQDNKGPSVPGGLVARLRDVARDIGMARYGHAHAVLEAADAITTLTIERDAALRACVRSAREAGEAQGRLEASELAGVVDGWRDRALAAEAREARLREALEAAQRQLEKSADQFAFYADQHATKRTPDGDSKAATNHQWALACAKVDHRCRIALTVTDSAGNGGAFDPSGGGV